MPDGIARVDAATLKGYLHDGKEIALLDAREEVPFDASHILMASCVPVGRIETIVGALLPRRSTRIVWCDDGETNLAARAAKRMIELGYTDVAVLEGGNAAWEKAGYRLYEGVHVPSKAFAEVIEHQAGTPHIPAEELKRMMDDGEDFVLFDTRTFEEYNVNSIPGAVSAPGAELVYRFKDLVPSPETTVVINCGGRTRSIIGAQSVIAAGYPNKVVSLTNGTQGWHLAGFEIIVGATKKAPDVSAEALAASKEAAEGVAERFAIPTIDGSTLKQYEAERDTRTLYVLDVRTAEEYVAGHLPGVKHIAGGQLVQETDRHLAAWGARVVLVDDTGVRATMTASWLKQMGWDVSVMPMDAVGGEMEKGACAAPVLGLDNAKAEFISVDELASDLDAGTAIVADLNWSKAFFKEHIAGAWFLIRSRLADDIGALPNAEMIVLTSPDGALAQLAAAEAAKVAGVPVKVLKGGTAAWAKAGKPLTKGQENLASAVEDIRIRAREKDVDMEEAMKAYLTWEVELVNQMATDDDQRFQIKAS